MNKRQKIVLVVGLIAFLAIGYLAIYDYPFHAFSRPLGDWFDPKTDPVNLPRLFILWTMTIALSAVGIFLLKTPILSEPPKGS